MLSLSAGIKFEGSTSDDSMDDGQAFGNTHAGIVRPV